MSRKSASDAWPSAFLLLCKKKKKKKSKLQRAHVADTHRLLPASSSVESVNDLTLQVQMQNAQLINSVRSLYEQGSPLGSLESYCKAVHSADTDGVVGTDDASSKPRHSKSPYDPQRSSSVRKDVLLQWRDLPLVEHTGPRSFEWWVEVCKAEVGRWKESG